MFSNFRRTAALTRALGTCIGLLLFVSQQINANDSVRVNGFTTFALTYNGSSEVDFATSFFNHAREDFSFAPDSVIGLQINARLSDSTDFVGQFVLQDTIDNAIANKVEFAFLRYQFNRNWSARIGRLNNRVYMVSDFRSVGHGFLWARPPVEFYATSTVIDRLDGIGVKYSNDIANGYATFHASFGHTSQDIGGSLGDLSFDINNILSLNAQWQGQDWTLHSSYVKTNGMPNTLGNLDPLLDALQEVPATLWPEAQSIADRFGVIRQSTNYVSFGAKYDDGRIVWQSEIANYSASWLLLPAAYYAYTSIGYHWNNFTPYIVLALSQPRRERLEVEVPAFPDTVGDDVAAQIAALAQNVEAALDNVKFQQRSIALGVRWDITPAWALKLQYDHFDVDTTGGATVIRSKERLTLQRDVHVNLFHLSVSTVF